MRERSLYETLETELGLRLDHGRRTLEAAVASKEHARLLDIKPGSPMLLLKSVAYLMDGRAIEYFLAWHRGDRSRFEVHLRRDGRQVRGLGQMAVGTVGADDVSSLTNDAGLPSVDNGRRVGE